MLGAHWTSSVGVCTSRIWPESGSINCILAIANTNYTLDLHRARALLFDWKGSLSVHEISKGCGAMHSLRNHPVLIRRTPALLIDRLSLAVV